MAGEVINLALTEAQVGAFPATVTYDINPQFGRYIKFTAVKNFRCFWTGIISNDSLALGTAILRIKYHIASATNPAQSVALKIKIEIISPSESNAEDFVYTTTVAAPVPQHPNKHTGLTVAIPSLESAVVGSYFKFTLERLADSPNDTVFGDFELLAAQLTA